jgi:hypothetical protein
MAQTITMPQLVDLMEDRTAGARILTMVARTNPKCLKKTRDDKTPVAVLYPEGIERLNFTRCMVGFNYEANMQKALPDPSFEAGPIWNGKGKRVGRFVVEHTVTGNRYFRVRPDTDREGLPRPLQSRWTDLATGEAIEGEALAYVKKNILAGGQKEVPAIQYRLYGFPTVEQVILHIPQENGEWGNDVWDIVPE